MDLAIFSITATAIPMITRSQTATRWISDSGWSKHVSNSNLYFAEFAPCEEAVQVGNYKVITLLSIRTVNLTTVVDELNHFSARKEVLYTPDIMLSLISMCQAKKCELWVGTDRDLEASTKEKMDVIYKGSGVVGMYRLETYEGLYKWVAQVRSEQVLVTKTELIDDWQQRVGRARERVSEASWQHVICLIVALLRESEAWAMYPYWESRREHQEKWWNQKDVTIGDGIEPGKASSTDRGVIEFELSDENVIFDDTVQGSEPLTEESEVVPSIVEFIYKRMESEPLAVVNLDDLTYYPSARRSTQRTAEISPDRFNYDKSLMVMELNVEIKVLGSDEMTVASHFWPVWQKAMEDEMAALDNMGTGDLAKLSPGQNIVKTKWCFDIKRHEEGAAVRPKARLVAKRFKQIERFDFQEVCLPVLRYATVRLVLSLPVSQNHQGENFM